MSNWTTRVDPTYTRPYGVEEVHNVWFTPKGWPGKGPAVTLLIPECEVQLVLVAPDGEPRVLVNRPKLNRNIKYWLRYACKLATINTASLSIACDTAEQAEQAAKRAARLLRHHERAALERMYEAKSRGRDGLQ